MLDAGGEGGFKIHITDPTENCLPENYKKMLYDFCNIIFYVKLNDD